MTEFYSLYKFVVKIVVFFNDTKLKVVFGHQTVACAA